jgi:hypothetical protein
MTTPATPEIPQPQAPQPQGALSAALSSLVAVGHYASRACAAARYDFATLFAHGASPAQRARAAGGLALTAVIVVVLGYAALQEWRQHIIYATEIARQQALKAAQDEQISEINNKAAHATLPEGAVQCALVGRKACDALAH